MVSKAVLWSGLSIAVTVSSACPIMATSARLMPLMEAVESCMRSFA